MPLNIRRKRAIGRSERPAFPSLSLALQRPELCRSSQAYRFRLSPLGLWPVCRSFLEISAWSRRLINELWKLIDPASQHTQCQWTAVLRALGEFQCAAILFADSTPQTTRVGLIISAPASTCKGSLTILSWFQKCTVAGRLILLPRRLTFLTPWIAILTRLLSGSTSTAPYMVIWRHWRNKVEM